MTPALDTIDHALDQLRSGRPIIVVDDADRENEGDFIMPAASVTAEWMGFIIRHSSGVVCAPMPAAHAQALRLPSMVTNNEDPKGTAYTVSCDAAAGTSTGISAADRARTARVLAQPTAQPAALNRPGHIFPLIAKAGGVRERAGHTEAGVEFSRLAGFAPVAVIAEVVHDAGPMMRLDDLLPFAAQHGLVVVSIEDLAAYLDSRDKPETHATGEAVASPADTVPSGTDGPQAAVAATAANTIAPAHTDPVALPTEFGTFTAQGWNVGGVEHISLTAPGPEALQADDGSVRPTPLVRVHSECLTGDVFGSHRCDCGEQLDASLRALAARGGTLVYLRGQEGRGIGLFNKLRAYALQEHGRDTVDANTELGLPVDARDYAAAASILHALGIDGLQLLTNNPAKVTALQQHGITVTKRVGLQVPVRRENAAYLRTKRERMRHVLTLADGPTPPHSQGPASAADSPGAVDTPNGEPTATPAASSTPATISAGAMTDDSPTEERRAC